MTGSPDRAAPAGRTSPRASQTGSPTSVKSKSSGKKSPTPPTQAGSSSPTQASPSAAIEAEPAVGDGASDDGTDDDGYGSDGASRATTSISSSVRDYTFEANRRYHKFEEGRYLIPNDDPEQEREDMKHAMITHLCDGKLHFAPLDNPQTILDLGTGTGIWAIDMGDEFPEADILGIDLSPIQPTWVPPNVRFVVDDFEAEWIQDPESIDYVHARHLAPAIRNWAGLLSKAYKHVALGHPTLKPGGWLELQDIRMGALYCDDGTMREDNSVSEWLAFVAEGLAVLGVDLLTVHKNKQRLIDAGFVNVEERIYKLPLGVWPRDQKMKMVGLYNRSNFLDGLQGISVKPLGHGLKWTPEKIEVFLAGVRKEIMDSSQHAYIPFHAIIGQKPA